MQVGSIILQKRNVGCHLKHGFLIVKDYSSIFPMFSKDCIFYPPTPSLMNFALDTFLPGRGRAVRQWAILSMPEQDAIDVFVLLSTVTA